MCSMESSWQRILGNWFRWCNNQDLGKFCLCFLYQVCIQSGLGEMCMHSLIKNVNIPYTHLYYRSILFIIIHLLGWGISHHMRDNISNFKKNYQKFNFIHQIFFRNCSFICKSIELHIFLLLSASTLVTGPCFNISIKGVGPVGSTPLVHGPIAFYVKFLRFKQAHLFCFKFK